MTLFLAWKKSRIIEIIGTFLTPILLVGIVSLILVGLFVGTSPQTSDLSALESFTEGVNQGYQTMDLLAAFFFSATTVTFIANSLVSHKDKLNLERLSFNACMMGALLLALVYVGFVNLGAEYAPALINAPREKLLVIIAEQSLGSFALPIAAIIIALACLTTATILASLFADFLHKDMLQEKIPRSLALIVTLVIGYTVSLLGFDSLAVWIANALTIAYPALIVYAIAAIVAKKSKYNYKASSFWLVLLISVLVKVLANVIL